MPMIKCKFCGKSVQRREDREYCSMSCYGKAQKAGMTRHEKPKKGKAACENCGEVFTLRRRPDGATYHGRFCSQTCSNAYQGANRTKKHGGGDRRRVEKIHALRRLGRISPACEICGFDREIDAAHIVPASKGGRYSEENRLWLCPNHHRLFDKRKLYDSEVEMLPVYAQEVYRDETLKPLNPGPSTKSEPSGSGQSTLWDSELNDPPAP